ncbi:MAG: YciI family protein [Panacagrimonas sp.]
MLYMIFGLDAPDAGPRRAAARPAHLERLHALQAEGRVVLAGPLPRIDAPSLDGGVAGSLIVAEFDSLEAAKAWIATDPFTLAEVYASVEVRPFVKSV